MTLFENSMVYEHPWHIMTMASWRKYPNKHAAQVLSVDILDRRQRQDQSHVLDTERIITCKSPVPSAFLRKLLSLPDVIVFREVSSVNSKTGNHVMYSENITMRHLAVLTERTQYTRQTHATTFFSQEASVDVLGALGHVARRFETLTVNTFKNNAVNGKRALDSVIDTIKREMNEWEHSTVHSAVNTTSAVTL